MAADGQEERVILSTSLGPPHAQFVEILCKSSGKIRRFAAGTTAGWALERMNQTLDAGLPPGSLIAAVKEGEEPVAFGPSATLSLYGHGWSLQTITEEDLKGERNSTGRTSEASEKFLEIKCRSGKVARFAAGTRAGCALLYMNKKLGPGSPSIQSIEAVKDGEEPVTFDPNAVLVDYGSGWSLQTDLCKGRGHERAPPGGVQDPARQVGVDKKPGGELSMSHITPGYLGRVLLAFVFMFFLGGLLILFLEYLPQLLALISPPT